MDLLQLLPQTIQHDIIDFHDCKLKDGRDATRITLSRMLTAEEKSQMSGEHFVGINCIAHYRYSPEMKSPPPCGDITPMEVVSNSRAEPQS